MAALSLEMHESHLYQKDLEQVFLPVLWVFALGSLNEGENACVLVVFVDVLGTLTLSRSQMPWNQFHGRMAAMVYVSAPCVSLVSFLCK